MPEQRGRSAKTIIDQAIKENRTGEWLVYGFAVALVGVGVVAIIFGMAVEGHGLVAVAGSIASALFYPAMKYAKEIRRENLAIRLLEAPLSNAATAEEAAMAIQKAFSEIFGRDKG